MRKGDEGKTILAVAEACVLGCLLWLFLLWLVGAFGAAV